MRIKAQISMAMNLDKCLGCHTCSVTCKNTWTNRPGTEYMYFNNVETRPGTGYPRNWEDQQRWRGGWTLANGKLRLASGSAAVRLAKLFYNPEQPVLDDYYEPYTYDYETLTTSPRREHQPVARPRSVVTGERMEVTWGPNWDDDLAGTQTARKDQNLEAANEKIGNAIKMDLEDLFMKYLPRTCNHCLNPACVAACPSGAIYKRDEDGVVVISQDQCRGWRACVPACPYKKVFYNWKTNKSEKCLFCYPRLESGQPTLCADTCVGRLRYMGVLLYDMDRVREAASTTDPGALADAERDVICDPFDPEVIAAAREQGVPDSWIDAAQHSPVYRIVKEWRLALPLHAEYRTLPMVWYIPPLSPVAKRVELRSGLAEADEMRIPVQYLAELFSAGNPEPVRAIIDDLVELRRYMRAKEFGSDAVPGGAGPYTDEQAQRYDEMYRLLALAKYNERFNIPESARPTTEECHACQVAAGFNSVSVPEEVLR